MKFLALVAAAAGLSVGAIAPTPFDPPEIPSDYLPWIVEADGKSAMEWRQEAELARAEADRMRHLAYQRRRRVKYLQLALRKDVEVRAMVRAAAIAYGVSEPLIWSKIYCESRGYALAKNRKSTASGLGQFLDSTWASTPFGKAGISVFDPFANALAVAWMHDVGRGGEWAASASCWS